MLDRRLAWIETAHANFNSCKRRVTNSTKNCHAPFCSHKSDNFLANPQLTNYQQQHKSNNFRLKLPIFQSGLFLLFLFTCANAEARTGANRMGETLPYDAMDVRAQAESDLEQDLIREFVRGSSVNRDDMTYRYPKKTYSVSGSLPRKFQCYSCMSLSYQNNWSRLQHLYVQPKIFTDRCERPADYEKMPTVECGSVCVSLVEADMEGGVFLGFKYIRGCINRILMHDFNLSALRTHRMTQSDLCRSLPRAVLFNNPRTAPQVFGEVNLCTCFGEKCNSATQSIASAKESSSRLILSALLLFLFHRIF
ncbi:hypothetical protein M3Y97_00133500 [Aphelenchoides bicaudatus]|nr:hypothetical protein M3Y97_00133500 [Aphelenchoides bicaudatus]